MANLPEFIQIYESFRPLAERYSKFTKYKNRSFVISELKRVLLKTVKEHYEGQVDIQFKIKLHSALSRRVKCFGMVEKWYKRHDKIPRQYVNKLGGYEKISWERSDIVQELNIKMLTTIRAWGRRYREFQHTGRYEPVQVDIFIRTAMVNRMKDFFKYVQRAPSFQEINYASEGGNIDIVSHSASLGETIVDLPGKRLMICGEDLLTGLQSSKEKAVFILNFMGFKPHELDKKFASPGFVPSQIVALHQVRLFQNSDLRQLLSERIHELVV